MPEPKDIRDQIIKDVNADELKAALRVLWAVVEERGGILTIPHEKLNAVNGQLHVWWGPEGITVCVAEGSPTRRQ